jgi:hypothetical protein
MNSILKLAPLIREGTQCANGTSKSERHFLDFVVDGESLWEALGERHGMVSILCAEYSADETAKAVGRLILNEKADLPNDRRSLFVCSECGDLGCGAITAVVRDKAKQLRGKHSATRTPTKTRSCSMPTKLLAPSYLVQGITSARLYTLSTFFDAQPVEGHVIGVKSWCVAHPSI